MKRRLSGLSIIIACNAVLVIIAVLSTVVWGTGGIQVYLRSKDEIVACGDAEACTKSMKLASVNTFYSLIAKTRKYVLKKYIILIENHTGKYLETIPETDCL